MPKSKGFRYKSRDVLTKPKGSRQGPNPEIYLREFKVGDKVAIKIIQRFIRGCLIEDIMGR